MKNKILICLVCLFFIEKTKAQLTPGKVPVARTPVGSATSSLTDGPITIVTTNITIAGNIIPNSITLGGTNILAIITNAAGTTFVPGLGLKLTSGTLSNNIVAGANVTVTAGVGGQLTVASTVGGSGTVTSVAATVPSLLSVAGSPVTTAGTLAFTYSGTPLPIANGGTAATSASAARTGFGLVIGTDVQAQSANLNSWSGITTASKADAFTTGTGITNNGGVLSNNVVAGSNITITRGANGQLTVASSGSGGGISGTVINTGASILGAIPYATDLTGTNVAPSSITIVNLTNLLAGSIYASSKITITNTGPGMLKLDDSDQSNFASITAAASTTANMNLVLPSAPSTGILVGTVTQTTNIVVTAQALNNYTSYASGTVYSLTTTPALLDFGTTDPSITITVAGTYRLSGSATIKYTGATFAANQTAILKLRVTSGTPADVSNATKTITLDIVTTKTATVCDIKIPTVYYTAAANDIIQIFGSVSVAPSAGTLDATAASIDALRIQ